MSEWYKGYGVESEHEFTQKLCNLLVGGIRNENTEVGLKVLEEAYNMAMFYLLLEGTGNKDHQSLLGILAFAGKNK